MRFGNLLQWALPRVNLYRTCVRTSIMVTQPHQDGPWSAQHTHSIPRPHDGDIGNPLERRWNAGDNFERRSKVGTR